MGMNGTRAGLFAIALALTSCGENHESSALAAFDRFQTALFARDEDAVRNVLTRESRQIVPHLPWDRVATQQPLEALGCNVVNGRYWIEVRDPNQNDELATYVVVREDSHWRVDLIESTRFNHREIALPGPAMTLRPKALTDVEIAEASARMAEQK